MSHLSGLSPYEPLVLVFTQDCRHNDKERNTQKRRHEMHITQRGSLALDRLKVGWQPVGRHDAAAYQRRAKYAANSSNALSRLGGEHQHSDASTAE